MAIILRFRQLLKKSHQKTMAIILFFKNIENKLREETKFLPKLVALATAFLLIFSFAACDKAEKKKKKKKRVARLVLDEIELERGTDGLFYQMGATEPFTGVDIVEEPHRLIEGKPVPLAKVPYKDGLLHGTKRSFYPFGNLREERVYENGEAIFSTVYYSDGVVKIKTELNEKDLAAGKYKRWHRNGKLAAQGQFDDDERFHGELKEYDESGAMKADYLWEHGKIVDVFFETPKQILQRLEHYGLLETEKAADMSKEDVARKAKAEIAGSEELTN